MYAWRISRKGEISNNRIRACVLGMADIRDKMRGRPERWFDQVVRRGFQATFHGTLVSVLGHCVTGSRLTEVGGFSKVRGET